MRTAARRRRNYLLRVVYLTGLLLFLLLAWTITRDMSGNGGLAQRAQQQEQLGTYFFAFFSMFCVGAMALVGPVLTSTAINGERQAKTLPVLLMTPLTAWQIVSGKLFSRLLTAFTLIGLSLPVLALVRLLGGVDLAQMFGVVSLCAVMAMFGAALGLLFSILLRRAYAVILLSYILMAVLYFFGPMLLVALFMRHGPRMPLLEFIGDYDVLFVTGILGWGEMRSTPVNWELCVIIHLIATAVLLVIASLLVRQLAKREGEGAINVPQDAMGQAELGPAASITPDLNGSTMPAATMRMRTRPGRTISDMPILWRELRRPLMTRRWQRIVAVAGVCGLLGLGYVAAIVNNFVKEPGFQAFLAGCFYTIMMLLTCVISATCIAQEKESESWTVLLASPLSGSAIVWGKTIGVLRRLLWPMMLVVANSVLVTLAGIISPLEALIAIAVISGFNAIWVATGVAISLRFRKVTAAVILNLSLPIALYGGWSLVAAVLDSLARNRDILLRLVTWYLPYYYIVEGIAGGYRDGSGSRHLPGSYDSIPLQLFALITLLVAGLHVLIAAGILQWTARRLNRAVGRSPQLESAGKSRNSLHFRVI